MGKKKEPHGGEVIQLLADLAVNGFHVDLRGSGKSKDVIAYISGNIDVRALDGLIRYEYGIEDK